MYVDHYVYSLWSTVNRPLIYFKKVDNDLVN